MLCCKESINLSGGGALIEKQKKKKKGQSGSDGWVRSVLLTSLKDLSRRVGASVAAQLGECAAGVLDGVGQAPCAETVVYERKLDVTSLGPVSTADTDRHHQNRHESKPNPAVHHH